MGESQCDNPKDLDVIIGWYACWAQWSARCLCSWWSCNFAGVLVLWLRLVVMQLEAKMALSMSQGWSLGEAGSGGLMGLSLLWCMVAEWFARPQCSEFVP